MNAATINKLLTALNECTEWGQVFILDSLSNYTPKDEREAQSICERITPRLAHANAAVVLSAVKVLMKYMEMMSQDADFVTNMTKKLAPPLVTLLSSEPEVIFFQLFVYIFKITICLLFWSLIFLGSICGITKY